MNYRHCLAGLLVLPVVAACAPASPPAPAATPTATLTVEITPAGILTPIVPIQTPPPPTLPLPTTAPVKPPGPPPAAGPVKPQAVAPRDPPPTLTNEPMVLEPPRPATHTPSPAPPSVPAINLRLVADGFEQPVYLTHAGDGSGRLFVVERAGKVRVIQNGAVQPNPFLDITGPVQSKGQEQGLLSLAFHPNFPQDRRVYVDYTNNKGDTVIARYQTTPDLRAIDPATGQILLTIAQPYPNHNGGGLLFGPDGYLYIGTGDGGLANDPHENAQNPAALLGKMLRISVDFGEPYTVPADNPFVNDPAFRPEVWALGLRNPWRFSFDRLTGDMFIADVGQNKYEEINFEAAGSPGGLNFGWDVMEGFHCFQADTCRQDGLTLPVAEYDHSLGCSVTGGYVYRGAGVPALQGVYLYADYCSGRVWALRSGEKEPVQVLESGLNVSSFGEDEAGELYLIDLKGGIYQVF